MLNIIELISYSLIIVKSFYIIYSYSYIIYKWCIRASVIIGYSRVYSIIYLNIILERRTVLQVRHLIINQLIE